MKLRSGRLVHTHNPSLGKVCSQRQRNGALSQYPCTPGGGRSQIVKRSSARSGRLTERNLKLLTEFTMAPKRTSMGADTSSRSTNTTDKEFGVQINRNGIVYGRLDTKAPCDEKELRNFLMRPRQSKSPEDEQYNEYVAVVEHAGNEATLQHNSWSHLAKRPTQRHKPGYFQDYNFQWTEVNGPLTDGLSDPKPDISESYRTKQYPTAALDSLGGALAPTQYKAAMPRLCVEYKGPDGTMEQAERQCAYDGAIMSDSALQVHNYMGKEPGDFYEKTQALTIAANGDLVRLYANHVIGDGSSLQYHQYPLSCHMPTESLQNYKDTYRHVRNAQDWARQLATETKDTIHEYVNSQHSPEWNWHDEAKSYYRFTEGKIEWAESALMTPPSTGSSGEGRRKKKGKGRRK